MIVSKISLLSTRTFAPDGRHFILNNAQISDGIIINYTRTTGYAVSYTIVVAATTPAEKLLKLKNYITTWIHRRRNVWNEDFMFEVSDLDKVNATVSIDFWCMLIGINWFARFCVPYLSHPTP
jgi:small-conductance mechanosensitive channel